MTSRCKANPCCGDPYKCIVPLPQYRSGLYHLNECVKDEPEVNARDKATSAVPDVPELVRYGCGLHGRMYEKASGEYVRYDQAAAMLAAKDVEIERLNEEVVKNGEDEDKEQWLYWRRRYKKAAQKISNQKGELYSRYKNNERLLKRAEAAEAKLASHKAARQSYADLFDGDVGSIHENIRELKAELAQIKEQAPVAKVVSAHGDPEAFGERELQVIADIQKMPYGTSFYAAPVDQTAEIERLREVVKDCLKELDRSSRPSYAWQLKARSALSGKEPS